MNKRVHVCQRVKNTGVETKPVILLMKGNVLGPGWFINT